MKQTVKQIVSPLLNDRRSDLRVVLRQKVTVEIAGRVFPAMSKELSPGGALLETNAVFPVGVSVFVDLYVGHEVVSTRARVIANRDEGLALAFTHQSRAFKETLSDLLAPHLFDRPDSTPPPVITH